MKEKKLLLISTLSLAVFFLLRHFLFYDRGLSFFEEGLFYYLYDSIAEGKMLYRDVCTYTAPLANYFFALVLKLFGSELLIVRAASIVLTTLGLITIFFILREFLSNFWAWIGALVSYSMYYLWWYSYGYEFGSLFCYLTILSAYLFVKKNKTIYFILMILCSVGATGYNLIFQGIPFVFAILTMFILFHKRVNHKYAILYLGSVVFINMLIFSFFIVKSSFITVLYNLTPFLQGESSKQPFSLVGKFPFFNLLEHYNAYFPENLSPSSLYIFLKGWVYIFIYYMPILNLILFKVNYSKVFKQLNFPLQFLYLLLLFYSLFLLTRPYLFYPVGHSDAFFFSPTILFFYINSYYVLRNICKQFDLKYVNAIKYFFVAVIAFFYLIIQV
ncbi:MAG: glycosyltransferase family 39 protein, partial [Candidatus Helarchaeota archaeon]|nr:glycosyltransferase family 39 protein [Candidatus Helarchaeota archaeon]